MEQEFVTLRKNFGQRCPASNKTNSSSSGAGASPQEMQARLIVTAYILRNPP